ncbi:hypothetical protein KCP70_16690 [Salmonella enterica subsp. enterica]|nr:hypothetical protein KCP70_16690 [Salmonella enterica subsp. enterica]
MRSAGLFAASGVLYAVPRLRQAPAQAAAPALSQRRPLCPRLSRKRPYHCAPRITVVAPVALFILMPCFRAVPWLQFHPANVVQANQWSRDNPTLQAMPLFRGGQP